VRRFRLLLLLPFVGSLLISCTEDGMPSTEASTDASVPDTDHGTTCDEPLPAVEERDVAYAAVDGVEPNLLSLDVSVPVTCEPVPVVVWVHGGAWQAGDKANAAVADKRELFNRAGYAFVAVNYRLSPDPVALDDADRVTYPVHEQDVADALAYLDDRGVDATVLDANPYSHEDVSRLLGAEGGDAVVTPAVLDFYAGCLA